MAHSVCAMVVNFGDMESGDGCCMAGSVESILGRLGQPGADMATAVVSTLADAVCRTLASFSVE